MAIYVLEVWDKEGVHSEGTLEVIKGDWKLVQSCFRSYGIMSESQLDNIQGDHLYWWPRMQKNVHPRYFYMATEGN